MVTIYSTPVCPYCQMAKAYFQQRDIEYKDIDVSKDVQAQKEMIEKSQQMGVPVIDMDGEIIVGFNKKRIEELLAMRTKVAA